MIKLIASDLDGTIINEDNTISENNMNAIHDINSSNINFAICTGKTYPIIQNSCSRLNASFGIFGNGNQIINLKTGEEIYKKVLTISDVISCINIAKQYNLHVHLYTSTSIITEKLKYMDLRNHILKNSLLYNSNVDFIVTSNILEYVSSRVSNDILKLVISNQDNLSGVQKDILQQLDLGVCRIQKYGKYKDKIIDKEYEYLDITPKNINKNDAVTILSNYLNINKEEVMALGDNMNDLDMIKNSGIGIAVANAYDEVKKVANYTTTTSVENGAFAEGVYKFIKF